MRFESLQPEGNNGPKSPDQMRAELNALEGNQGSNTQQEQLTDKHIAFKVLDTLHSNNATYTDVLDNSTLRTEVVQKIMDAKNVQSLSTDELKHYLQQANHFESAWRTEMQLEKNKTKVEKQPLLSQNENGGEELVQEQSKVEKGKPRDPGQLNSVEEERLRRAIQKAANPNPQQQGDDTGLANAA